MRDPTRTRLYKRGSKFRGVVRGGGARYRHINVFATTGYGARRKICRCCDRTDASPLKRAARSLAALSRAVGTYAKLGLIPAGERMPMIKNVCPAAALLALFAGACAAQSQHLVTVCLKGGEPAYAYVYDAAGKVAQSGRGAACRAAGHWVSELSADGKPAPKPTPGLRGPHETAGSGERRPSSGRGL